MSDYQFGVTYRMPTEAARDKWDAACIKLGGSGYAEVNRVEGTSPGINNGRYQGWFLAPNRGEPHDSRLREAVIQAVEKIGMGGHGGYREGAGRKPGNRRPPVKASAVKLSDDERAIAETLGGGNLSEGIRVALRKAVA